MAYLGDIRKGPRRIGVPKPYGGVPPLLSLRRGNGQRGGWLLPALAAHGVARSVRPVKLANKLMDDTGFSNRKGGRVLRSTTGYLSGITGYGKRRSGGSRKGRRRTIVIM